LERASGHPLSGPAWFAGLMSGTSLDGVDAVIVRLVSGAPPAGVDAAEAPAHILELHHAHLPFPSSLRGELLALQRAGEDELARSALAAVALSRHCAATLLPLIAKHGIAATDIRAIGAHGQTVRHQPGAGYTIQLIDGALLAELTGIPVVCDFRSADIAAGGQGAPLVPAFHAAVLGGPSSRAVVNIGGMANITVLRPRRPVTGFDCGPGNVLLDAWVMRCRGDSMDRDGKWAAGGTVMPELLDRCLAHPFFGQRPPKSCGREDFDLHWLLGMSLEALDPVDVQATLVELTVRSIADAIEHHVQDARAVLVCGGGALNTHLIARLCEVMPERTIDSTAAAGLAPMHVEAAAFAWLARQRMARLFGNLPAVTGARGRRVLGAVYPAPR
jgi:anhydro-N-acetylmuramic acid kinase